MLKNNFTPEELARIEEYQRHVHQASGRLYHLKDPVKKARLLWGLANFDLRGAEDLRPAGGFDQRYSKK